MNRIFEFKCKSEDCGAYTEKYASDETWLICCKECGETAKRVVSPVRCKLDHSFPGEEAKWIKKHEQGAKERAGNDQHRRWEYE